MSNPLADLSLALTVMKDLQVALPILAQAAADLKQAVADRSNPTQATADVQAAITVVLPLIENISALLPPPTTVTPPVAA